MMIRLALLSYILSFCIFQLSAQEDRGYKIFQFPTNQIPRVDGDASDWDMFNDSYTLGSDQLKEDEFGKLNDSLNLAIKVRVGWVKGMNRLYFLYEAFDNFWSFADQGLRNDIYEVVVDGDRSGGPFIEKFRADKNIDKWESFFNFHGQHAQNYHIFTPAYQKDWCMLWGPQQWLKTFPYANAAYNYSFKNGESGKLTLEFWISVYDMAALTPQESVASTFYDHKKIGLCWAVIDYDADTVQKDGFWNLSQHHTMYGNASELLTFELMPLEQQLNESIKANWKVDTIDLSERKVVFKDLSKGEITNWKWDFGDGESSSEQHPTHTYKAAGNYVVTLHIEGSEGTSKFSRVWDVSLK